MPDLSYRLSSLYSPAAESAYFHLLAVANDGYAITAGRNYPYCGAYTRYLIRTFQFFPLQPASPNACSAFIAGSAEAHDRRGHQLGGDIDRYVAGTGTLSTVSPGLGLELTSAPVLDRHANHIVLNKTRVYDGNFTLIGELPATTKAVALNPAGTIAWTYDSSGAGPQAFGPRVVNPPPGYLFPELGAGTTPRGIARRRQ